MEVRASLLAVALAMSFSTATNAWQPVDGLIIKYKDNVDLSQKSDARALERLSIKTLATLSHKRFMFNQAQVVTLSQGHSQESINAIIKRIQSDPDVEYVEADTRFFPLLVPNDSNYRFQWHYKAGNGINLEQAWDMATGDGVVVAVLDTGFTGHFDLINNIVEGYDMISDPQIANDGNGRDASALDPGDWVAANECGQGSPARNSTWHGTHVAGTIGALTNNNKDVAGVAFGAKVLPVRVLGKCGGLLSDISDGVIWAAGGSLTHVPTNPTPAKVINMSLGGNGSCSNTMQNAIDVARFAFKSTVVVAAGNAGGNASAITPANCSGVITVAATDRSGDRSIWSSSSSSNYGSVVDIAAPGTDVLSTINSGSTSPTTEAIGYKDGTSMAAPHVAGVAALMLSVNPALTPDEVESKLKESAKSFPTGSSCYDNVKTCGAGILDAQQAILSVVEQPNFELEQTSYSIFLGNSEHFEAINSNDTNNNFQYSWDLGDGSLIMGGDTLNYTYQERGSYNLKVTATNGIKTSDEKNASVIVYGFEAFIPAIFSTLNL